MLVKFCKFAVTTSAYSALSYAAIYPVGLTVQYMFVLYHIIK